jgi:hypothetical protein
MQMIVAQTAGKNAVAAAAADCVVLVISTVSLLFLHHVREFSSVT